MGKVAMRKEAKTMDAEIRMLIGRELDSAKVITQEEMEAMMSAGSVDREELRNKIKVNTNIDEPTMKFGNSGEEELGELAKAMKEADYWFDEIRKDSMEVTGHTVTKGRVKSLTVYELLEVIDHLIEIRDEYKSKLETIGKIME